MTTEDDKVLAVHHAVAMLEQCRGIMVALAGMKAAAAGKQREAKIIALVKRCDDLEDFLHVKGML